jgi:hypothetical protein
MAEDPGYVNSRKIRQPVIQRSTEKENHLWI